MQQRYYDPAIGQFLSVDPISAYSGKLNQFNRYDYAYNNPYRFTDPDGRCADHYKDGSCSVAVDPKTGKAGVEAGKRLEAVLNKYDGAINKLKDGAKIAIVDHNGKAIGTMTGGEIKSVWNGTHFRVTSEQFDNGGAGGGTSGEWGLGGFRGNTGLNPQAVASYEKGATSRGLSAQTGVNTLIFHELGHLTHFGVDLSDRYPATNQPGAEFWRREQPTSSAGASMAGSVGAPFSCAVAGGCQ